MTNRYFIDQVDGYANIREYREIVADTLQNTEATTEAEARAVVDKAIEDGELEEVTAETLDPIAQEQYRQDGTYVEIAVRPFIRNFRAPEFWVDYNLTQDGELVRGDLHHEGRLDGFWTLPEVEAKLIAEADRIADEFQICVSTLEDEYENRIIAGSVAKLEASLRDLEEEIPEGGLQLGRDYEYVIG